jgi:hypothetical protein
VHRTIYVGYPKLTGLPMRANGDFSFQNRRFAGRSLENPAMTI